MDYQVVRLFEQDHHGSPHRLPRVPTDTPTEGTVRDGYPLGASPSGMASLSATVDRGGIATFAWQGCGKHVGRGGEGIRRRKFTRGVGHLA